jgi:hypothetical protein
MTHDLLTLMWEREFVNLHYRHVDPRRTSDPAWSDERAEQKERFSLAQAAPTRIDAIIHCQTRRFDPLSPRRPRSRIFQQDQREFDRPPPAVIVTARYLREPEGPDGARGDRNLRLLLLILLSTAQYRNAAYLLRESGVTANRAPEVVEPQKQRLLQLNELMSDPKPLGQLLQALEDSPLRAPQHELDELFGILQPRAIETILSWIGRSSNPQLKMLLEVAASRLASSNSAELIRLIGSDDEGVVLEAIRRAAALKSAAAVPALGKMLTVGEADMRLAAVIALNDIGSPGGCNAGASGIDEDREVRIVAVRAPGARNARAAPPRIEAAIKGKDCEKAPPKNGVLRGVRSLERRCGRRHARWDSQLQGLHG